MPNRFFEFKKNQKGEWFLTLPEWNGDPEDLQMVQGADQWLDLVSIDTSAVNIWMSTTRFDGAEVLTLLRLGEENLGGGGNYYLEKFNGVEVKLKIWLCNVTEMLFGTFPQKIYFQVAEV